MKLIGGEGTVVVAEDEALEPLGAAGIVETGTGTKGVGEGGGVINIIGAGASSADGLTNLPALKPANPGGTVSVYLSKTPYSNLAKCSKAAKIP